MNTLLKKNRCIPYILILLSSLSLTPLYGQLYYQSHFDKSIHREKDANEVLQLLEEKRNAVVLLMESKVISSKIMEEGLNCKIRLQLRDENGMVLFQTKAEKAVLFPGDLFFPEKLSFPSNLFRQYEQGKYTIAFHLTATDPEHKELLKHQSKQSLAVYVNDDQRHRETYKY